MPSYLQSSIPSTDDHYTPPCAIKQPVPSVVSLAETLYPGEDIEVVRVKQ